MIANNYHGLPLEYWYRLLDYRSDLSSGVIHLTKPSQEDLKFIRRNYNLLDDRAISEINKKSVDRLIDILTDEEIRGSDTESGFIIGDKRAACFQDIPLKSVKENVDYELQRLNINKLSSIRYCGVGLYFNKKFIYSKNGRPVIYEQKDLAKKLLNFNREEYWRIVNLELVEVEPYIENLFEGKVENIVSHSLYTKLVDWTHEREWRVPNKLTFKVEDLINVYDGFAIILHDRTTYDYFLQELERRWLEMDEQEKYSDSGIFDFDFRNIEPNKPKSNIFILEEM